MSLINLLTNTGSSTLPASWRNRSKEYVVDEIIEAVADKKSIVGPNNSDKARVVMLTREHGRNATFAAALDTVAETILALFPNEDSSS